MQKYQVNPITENFSSVNNSLMLKTCNKVGKNKHALKIKTNAFKEVILMQILILITNVLKMNLLFINENEINFYTVIDYTIKKKVNI